MAKEIKPEYIGQKMSFGGNTVELQNTSEIIAIVEKEMPQILQDKKSKEKDEK